MMISKKKKCTVPGFQPGVSISGGEFAKPQTAGMALNIPRFEKGSDRPENCRSW